MRFAHGGSFKPAHFFFFHVIEDVIPLATLNSVVRVFADSARYRHQQIFGVVSTDGGLHVRMCCRRGVNADNAGMTMLGSRAILSQLLLVTRELGTRSRRVGRWTLSAGTDASRPTRLQVSEELLSDLARSDQRSISRSAFQRRFRQNPLQNLREARSWRQTSVLLCSLVDRSLF